MLWLAVVLIFSVAIAVIRGGRLSNMGDIHLRMWWLLPLGFAMQLGAILVPVESDDLGTGLVLFSYLPLLILVILNKDRPGLWIAGVGVLMNFSVIALNGGMPVLQEASDVASGFSQANLPVGNGFKHVDLDQNSRLTFLADVIPLRVGSYGSVLSLGDISLAVGLGRFLENELRKPVRWFKRGASAKGGSALRY
jgi:hypothetical protein